MNDAILGELHRIQPDALRRGVSISATPFRLRDPGKIPRREFLYGRHLIRGFLSMTAAPGGVGKSSLELVEALAMATGRPLLGHAPKEPLRVWVWNGEDPREEIERRVTAICLHYGITARDIGGRLFIDSGRDSGIILATTGRNGFTIAEPVVEALTATITENRIDVVSVDPFVSSHQVSENDNGAIDAVAKTWGSIAGNTKSAVELVHHVRKGQFGQGEYSIEDGRGAKSLTDAARSARVLNVMTEEQAREVGIERRRPYFRADNGKANMAPPAENAEWFHLVSVPLGNGTPGSIVDDGDHVAVVTAWEWPDEGPDDMTVERLRMAQAAVQTGGPWRESEQSPEWIGIPIGRALGIALDLRGKRRLRSWLETWTATGMFEVYEGRDKRRKPCRFVKVGEAA